jgi:HK97 family phage prohead protease
MKTKLKFLRIPYQIKAKGENEDPNELVIEGYGAVKGNIDSYRDVISDGAFTKTIKENGERIAFCLQHDIRNPVGKILEISEDKKGLFVKVRISDANEDVKTKIREGILKEMSIGYVVMEAKSGEKDGQSVNFLTQIKLYEISLVTIAANELAMIENIKAAGQTNSEFIEDEFDRLLAIETNKEKKFEMMMLKALVLSMPLDAKSTAKPEENESTDENESPEAKNFAILFDNQLFTNILN